jgi:hypothetical protein
MNLVEINKSQGDGYFIPDALSDKGTIHNYLPIYDEMFAPYRDKHINLFEVGYQYGGSAKLWSLYFSKSRIRFIDIFLNVPKTDDVEFQLMDSNDLTEDYFKDFVPDIAIDDGSHFLKDQLHFIKAVWPVLREGGIMIIEDIQDIDNEESIFRTLNIPFEIIDNRAKQNRYDEVLLIFRK